MKAYARYLFVFAISATLSCTTLGPAVARLAATLGPERIDRITADVLSRYMSVRSRAEPEIRVEPSFWPPVHQEIAETIGPQEGAAEFLDVGFERFLQSFEAHLTRKNPQDMELVFDDDAFIEFIRLPRPRGCQGSPCDVPPCCGDGFRCWRCKPPRVTVQDAA